MLSAEEYVRGAPAYEIVGEVAKPCENVGPRRAVNGRDEVASAWVDAHPAARRSAGACAILYVPKGQRLDPRHTLAFAEALGHVVPDEYRRQLLGPPRALA